MSKLVDASSAWRNAGSKSWKGRQALKTSARSGFVKRWRLSTAILVGVILAAFSAAVVGQAMNATLLGTVTDASGAVVSGAKVTITEMKTGVSRSSATNESGNYEFPNLPPGQYEVAVERDG